MLDRSQGGLAWRAKLGSNPLVVHGEYGFPFPSPAHVVALLLAALGVYGVLAYSVARRTREIGIRIALGALPARVRRLVLFDGIRIALLGLLLGAPLAVGAGLVARTAVEGLVIADARTIFVVTAVLLGATLAASYLPARRAARVDPMVALRAE